MATALSGQSLSSALSEPSSTSGLPKKRKISNGLFSENGASNYAVDLVVDDSDSMNKSAMNENSISSSSRSRFSRDSSPPISFSPFPAFNQNVPGMQPLDLGMSIKGIPSVHTACIDGNPSLVEQLIRHKPEDVEAQDIVGSRPLHVAASSGQLNVIRFLLQCGADINACDHYQSTPLVVASSADVMELLVSFGASIDAKNINNISARSLSQSNPFFAHAIERGLQLRDRRRTLTRQFILEVTNPSRRMDDSIAVSALTTLSTPTFGSTLAPITPSLSPLTSPLSLSLSPSLQSRELSLLGSSSGNGLSTKMAVMEEIDLNDENKTWTQFPPSLASLIVSYLYPPASYGSSSSSSLKQFSEI